MRSSIPTSQLTDGRAWQNSRAPHGEARSGTRWQGPLIRRSGQAAQDRPSTAFVTDPRTGVQYIVVVSAFAVGFALWILYVDGVLPLGFPIDPARQRPWLVAQFVQPSP